MPIGGFVACNTREVSTMTQQAMHEGKTQGGRVTKLKDGTIVQGDGSSHSKKATRHNLYVVREGQLHVIPDAGAFRAAGYNRSHAPRRFACRT